MAARSLHGHIYSIGLAANRNIRTVLYAVWWNEFLTVGPISNTRIQWIRYWSICLLPMLLEPSAAR